MRGLMGNLSVLPLADLVELLARRRMTGSLTCERGTVRKTLHVREGAAVGAASNDPREYLGQLLVNFGHLDEDQLTKAFRTQEETKIRLGKVLTMVGIVPGETVREVLAIKIRETLLDVFLWESGLFSFDDEPPPAVDELDAAIPLADIAREAEFRATAWSAFRGEFPTGAAALEVDEASVPAGLGPDTVDARLLALARDGRTIDEIGLALHATDFHLYQRLYALARQGVLHAAPAGAAPAPPAGHGAAADLVERARALLAEGLAADAERFAARAVELAPDSGAACSILADAERELASRLRGELLEPPRRPRLRVPPPRIASLGVSAADKYLLSRCDGGRDVRQLVQLAPLRELDVLKAIRRFADAELIELG
ncbi:MAG TPA: DUF4388 domain-containing protein [Anaeromyxobacter sp.]|nr:DUF4388 domain-containing protein [Anaeromyxobacter sp.]